jgi:hypothetical protein
MILNVAPLNHPISSVITPNFSAASDRRALNMMDSNSMYSNLDLNVMISTVGAFQHPARQEAKEGSHPRRFFGAGFH